MTKLVSLLLRSNMLYLQAAYVINGNCKNVMNMSQADQFELWQSVLKGIGSFWLINLEPFLYLITMHVFLTTSVLL